MAIKTTIIYCLLDIQYSYFDDQLLVVFLSWQEVFHYTLHQDFSCPCVFIIFSPEGRLTYLRVNLYSRQTLYKDDSQGLSFSGLCANASILTLYYTVFADKIWQYLQLQ